MKSYFCISPVKYKGKRRINCQIQLTDEQAAPLLALRTPPIREIETDETDETDDADKAPAASSKPAASDATNDDVTAEQLATFSAAVGTLDATAGDFTSAGVPELRPLKKALGDSLGPINAALRNKLWAAHLESLSS